MFGKKNIDVHEFKPLLVEIEDEPMNPIGRVVFWIIMASFVFFLLWAILGKVDVVVTARGKFIPAGETKTVQPLTTGVVRSILISPGDYVRKGQVLMEIDPSDIQPELQSMQEDLRLVELEILRLEALLNNAPFDPDDTYALELITIQRYIYASTKQRLQEQIRVKRQELSQIREQLAAEEKNLQTLTFEQHTLEDRVRRWEEVRDIISRDDFEKNVQELKTTEARATASAHRVEELKSGMKRIQKEIDLIREDDRNRLLTELSEKKQRLLYLTARIEKSLFLSSRQQISSPVDGYVAQLLFHTVGGVVTPAEKLAHIVPTDSPLRAKVLVLNKDVGFIAKGMNATIKVDAYSFQRYGTLDGTLLQISQDSFEDKQLGFVYETFIQPEQTSLLVEGRETPVTTGMSVVAEINVGKRRIIEFFLYPLIKYLDEGISVK
ncbi:MAG: HlyD family type I secretion periplasmic adaptor subunit [Desulfovibrionales bacterium]